MAWPWMQKVSGRERVGGRGEEDMGGGLGLGKGGVGEGRTRRGGLLAVGGVVEMCVLGCSWHCFVFLAGVGQRLDRSPEDHLILSPSAKAWMVSLKSATFGQLGHWRRIRKSVRGVRIVCDCVIYHCRSNLAEMSILRRIGTSYHTMISTCHSRAHVVRHRRSHAREGAACRVCSSMATRLAAAGRPRCYLGGDTDHRLDRVLMHTTASLVVIDL